MKIENIAFLWEDILQAIQNKKENPESFQRIFIGSISELTHISTDDTAIKPKKREFQKSRIPVCFINDSKPQTYFTRREAQCVAYALKGYTNPQAAIALNLSKRTIEFYIKNIRRKLQCRNKAELIALINQSNFIDIADNVI